MLSILPSLVAPLVATAVNANLLQFTDRPVNTSLRSGAVRVEISYRPLRPEDGSTPEQLEAKNFRYRIFYRGALVFRDEQNTLIVGRLRLLDLDRDGTPEVITETFSGGAHCCTSTFIYTRRGDRFQKIDIGPMDGRGMEFADVDSNGTIELVGRDQSFFYAFSSYAGSFPPTVIYSLRNGQLVETTRNYPRFLRTELNRMARVLEEVRQEGSREINGILAGYVAQKALLNEFEEGWRFMVQRYDPNSEDGLVVYDSQGKPSKRYRDFPTALRAHLQRRGYIK